MRSRVPSKIYMEAPGFLAASPRPAAGMSRWISSTRGLGGPKGGDDVRSRNVCRAEGAPVGVRSIGILLFLGNSPMNYTDNTYPFRQDSTWLYYFGIAAGAGGDGGHRRAADVVFGDDPHARRHRLDARATVAGGAAESRTAPGRASEALDKARRGRTIHYLRTAASIGWRSAPAAMPLTTPTTGPASPSFAPSSTCAITAAEEVARSSAPWTRRWTCTSRPWRWCARACARATSRPGSRTSRWRRRRLSFPVIATIHGETLHNHYHGNTLAPGTSSCSTAAPRPRCTTPEISSTFPVDAAFDSRQKDVSDRARRPSGRGGGREAPTPSADPRAGLPHARGGPEVG